jgi:type I restriction enzyme, S subunit
VSDELMELPEGWAWGKLSDVAEKVGSGATPRGGSESYKLEGIPLIRSMNVHFDGLKLDGLAYLDDKQANELKNVEVKENDVLLNITGASIGRVTQAPAAMEGARVNQHVCIIRTQSILDANFLSKYLASPSVQGWIMAEEYGATRQALTKQMILNFDIPLPPLNEQKRIVAKIEELRERSQKARSALSAIPELCDKFRQSVLAAAFRGDLTADWREQNPDVEPASILLERIRYDRRNYWEEDELIKMQLKGKFPKDKKWKLKYREPIEPNSSDLPELPKGWSWATWDQISNWVTYGFTRPMPHMNEGIPIVTAKHVLSRRIETNDTHKTTIEAFNELSEKDRPKPGDILITKDGTLGRAAVVTHENQFCINQSVAVIWLRSCPINRHYLLAVIESPLSQKPILEKARGNAIQHLSITDFAKMVLPIPPIQEQEIIVEQLNVAFSAIEKVQAVAKQNLMENDQLDRSILAKAFRGELVEQDPNDEPAAVLLDRIRAEREQQPQGKAKKQVKKGKRQQENLE